MRRWKFRAMGRRSAGQIGGFCDQADVSFPRRRKSRTQEHLGSRLRGSDGGGLVIFAVAFSCSANRKPCHRWLALILRFWLVIGVEPFSASFSDLQGPAFLGLQYSQYGISSLSLAVSSTLFDTSSGQFSSLPVASGHYVALADRLGCRFPPAQS